MHGVAVKYVMEFDNVDTVKRAVEIDAGVSIVPEVTIMQEIAKQTLVCRAVQTVISTAQPPPFTKRKKVLSPTMKQFLMTYLRKAA